MTSDKTANQDFERIITLHRGQLLKALERMLSPAESEEVLQEASLRVWMILETLDIDAIKPYWYRVARNFALSRLRHEKVQRTTLPALVSGAEDANTFDADRVHESDESHSVLIEAINSMPPARRNVFVYRKIDGYSQKEIAQKMGISVNTVENHIANGMRQCRAYVLKKLAFEESASQPMRIRRRRQ